MFLQGTKEPQGFNLVSMSETIQIGTEKWKTLVIATILLTLVTVPAFSQSRLSPEDLDKIKLIVIEVVKKEITDSETRMKDYVNVRFDALQKQIDAVKNKLML